MRQFYGCRRAALQAGCDLVLLCNQSLPNAEGRGQAVDDLLQGLSEAQRQGHWQTSADSEQRRLRLLPTQPPQPWDELMLDARYMQALGTFATVGANPRPQWS